MEIRNLSNNTVTSNVETGPTFSVPILVIVSFVGIFLGFGLSRLAPTGSNQNSVKPSGVSSNGSQTQKAISTDSITSQDQLQVGKLYGNTQKNFKDTATGVLEKGSINGEGTHILNREGGASQRASLTSSAVDLDLFVGKKVEVKGETNTSNKTAWLMDVGSIKILE